MLFQKPDMLFHSMIKRNIEFIQFLFQLFMLELKVENVFCICFVTVRVVWLNNICPGLILTFQDVKVSLALSLLRFENLYLFIHIMDTAIKGSDVSQPKFVSEFHYM
eukprot:jgi/Picsp_1/6192/NSC_03546-R1_---NA---